jgi:choline transporter-like protein 2/4/5
LSKLLIMDSAEILASFFTHQSKIMRIQHHLSITAGPILTVLTGSSLITHGFFSVYGMCVDTPFLYFLEDLERNGSSAERPLLHVFYPQEAL